MRLFHTSNSYTKVQNVLLSSKSYRVYKTLRADMPKYAIFYFSFDVKDMEYRVNARASKFLLSLGKSDFFHRLYFMLEASE